jgi:hypothetical protein
MNPAELLVLIENLGGRLEVLPDGQLRGQRVAQEFHAAVREHKLALIALLRERERTPARGFLFDPEKLRASQEKYYRELAEKAAAPAPAATGFEYRPRSEQQWQRRITQTLRSSFGVAVADEPKQKAKAERKPKTSVTENTVCRCGHVRAVHDRPAPANPPLPPSLSTACRVNMGCDCPAFCPVGGVPLQPKPQAGDWTLCGDCQHPKHFHCTKYQKGKVNRLEPGESAYKILKKADGTHYGCRHFDPADPLCQCTSTGCSATDDGVNHCACTRFVNPWLVKKPRATTKNKATAGPKAASSEVTATASIPENGLAGEPVKTRRPRKKKSTAFTTGENLFPPTDAAVNS